MVTGVRLVAPAVMALLVLMPAAAEAKRACVEAHPEAQKLRRDERLVEARARLLVCANASCPEVIRRDCSRWLEEVEALLPYVTVQVRDDQGRPLPQARVRIDGVERDVSEPVPLDPGRHLFEATARGERRETSQVLRRGERGRVVTLTMPAPPPPAPLATAGPARDRRWAYTSLAAGAAGTAGFVLLAQAGRTRERDLRDRCAPTCPASDVQGVRWRYRLADASLLVGVGGFGLATYLLWPQQEPPRVAKTSWIVGPGTVTWTGHF